MGPFLNRQPPTCLQRMKCLLHVPPDLAGHGTSHSKAVSWIRRTEHARAPGSMKLVVHEHSRHGVLGQLVAEMPWVSERTVRHLSSRSRTPELGSTGWRNAGGGVEPPLPAASAT